jgi:PilZ domain
MTEQNAANIDERLNRSISTLSAHQKEKLLALCEDLQKDRRKQPRTRHVAEVIYADAHRSASGFIQNISAGGLYIEPESVLDTGGKITLTFDHPDGKGHIKITGNIVRKDPKGFAIKFTDAIESL